MTINNFDQSSSGLNLELSCYYDNDLSRMWFEETFHVLQYSGYRQNSILVYGNNFQDVSNFSLSDIDNYQVESNKQLLKAFINYVYTKPTYTDIKELLLEIDVCISDDIKTLWDAIETYIYDDSGCIEFLQDNFKQKYIIVTSRGYSQGDYSEVIIPESIISEFKDQTLETIGNYLQDEIDHLLWDAPIYCRLEIDGNEFYFDDKIEDVYSYDKDAMIEIFATNTPENLTLDQIEYIVNWLTENLPENPDYQY